MHKRCDCGHMMDLTLRTVIFAKKARIHNVPIFSCIFCSRSQVLPHLKEDLATVIHHFDNPNASLTIQFDQTNELASIICEYLEGYRIFPINRCYDQDHSLQDLIESRTNQLLDLYLLAKQMKDLDWMRQLQHRLSQIAGFSSELYRMTLNL